MTAALVDVYLMGERVLERLMAGIALVQPNLAADFTIMPEVDKGAKAFFTRFYQRRKEIKAAEPKQAIAIAFSCVPSWTDAYYFLGAIEDIDTVQAAGEIEQDLITMRGERKGIAWIEKSYLMRIIAKEMQVKV